VYTIGGGRLSKLLDDRGDRLLRGIPRRPLGWTLGDEARMGDHRWWKPEMTCA
jgi:hypothetical protein